MKIEITLKSGVQFVETSFSGIETLKYFVQWWDKGKGIWIFADYNLIVAADQIAAIRRIEEATETFEPVSNDPEEVWERERARKDDLR